MYTPNEKEIKWIEYSKLKLILNESINPLRDLVAFEAKDLKDLLVKDGYIKNPIELHGSIILGYKILDGFHRFSLVDEILKENIPFNTNIPCIFHSLLPPQEVFLFAVGKQVARRNLTPPERAELVRQARDLGVSKEEIKNTFGIKDRTFYRDLNPTSAENNRQSTAKNYYTHPQSNSLSNSSNRACQDDTFITAIVPNAESNTKTILKPSTSEEAVNLEELFKRIDSLNEEEQLAEVNKLSEEEQLAWAMNQVNKKPNSTPLAIEDKKKECDGILPLPLVTESRNALPNVSGNERSSEYIKQINEILKLTQEQNYQGAYSKIIPLIVEQHLKNQIEINKTELKRLFNIK